MSDPSDAPILRDQIIEHVLTGPGSYLRHLDPRLNALANALQADVAAGHDPELSRLWQQACARGFVIENKVNGLGGITLAPHCSGTLQDTINWPVWFQRLVLWPEPESDDLDRYSASTRVTVEWATVGGAPLHIGHLPIPIRVFGGLTASYPRVLGRRLLLGGQTVQVGLHNPTDVPIYVTGAVLCDGLNAPPPGTGVVKNPNDLAELLQAFLTDG